MTYVATIFHNESRDGFGRHTAWIDGFRINDPMSVAGYWDIDAPTGTDEAVADKVWEHTNLVDPIGGRAMNIGDVVALAEGDEWETRSVTYWAVEKCGFTQLDTNALFNIVVKSA